MKHLLTVARLPPQRKSLVSLIETLTRVIEMVSLWHSRSARFDLSSASQALISLIWRRAAAAMQMSRRRPCRAFRCVYHGAGEMYAAAIEIMP